MIKISKKISLVLKLLVLFSFPFLTLVLSFNYQLRYRAITAILAFIVSIFLLHKVKINEISKKILLISFITSCYIDKFLMGLYNGKINKIIYLVDKYIHFKPTWNVVFLIYGFVIFFSILFVVYLFYKYIIPKLKDFYLGLSKVEKRYLYIVLALAFIISCVVLCNTKAFGQTNLNYDIIYTSDSSILVKSDVWIHFSNAENDIRQPLFGLFALPFGILAHALSELAFFLPATARYEFVLTIIQFVLLGIGVVLLSRLVIKDESNKKYFFALFSLSFPYLLFGLVLEQYVFCLFYLILTIYWYFSNKSELNYPYLGAVSTLITSGVLFVFISKIKPFKKYVLNVLKLFGIFLIIAILSGQFTQVFTAKETLLSLMRFTGEKVPFVERLYQYLYFVRSLFIAPSGQVIFDKMNIKYEYYSYQMFKPSSISIIGLVVLAIMFISLIINRKNKVALLSGFWILFSFLVLCVIGWGTQENGLILYSLYFSWAFYILFYLLLDKIFKNNKIFKLVLTFSIVIFAVLNFRELYYILSFAFKYYVR